MSDGPRVRTGAGLCGLRLRESCRMLSAGKRDGREGLEWDIRHMQLPTTNEQTWGWTTRTGKVYHPVSLLALRPAHQLHAPTTPPNLNQSNDMAAQGCQQPMV
eukprot:59524-Pelagomonas_calceolata.AAC.6